MTILPHSLLVAAQPSRRWSAFARYAVSVASVLADAVVIVGRLRRGRLGLPSRGLWRGRAAAQPRQCRSHGGGPVRAAGHRPRRIRPDALPGFQAAPAAHVHLLERHFRHAARARVPHAGDGGVFARLDAAVLCDRPAVDRSHPLCAGLDRDPRQQGRPGHRAARVPDRQRRGHQRLRAALSAVEFRTAHRRRRAVDAPRLRPPPARRGARRSPPICVRRSTPRARCGRMRSTSCRPGRRPARSTAASTSSSISRSRSISAPSGFSIASTMCASPSTAGWRACSSRARRSAGSSGCRSVCST